VHRGTPDEALLGAIANGDQRAMQVLYARHHVRVYRFVLRLTQDRSLAEDIVSDVFIDVWRQAGSFKGKSRVFTWVLAIARHKALSALRQDHSQICGRSNELGDLGIDHAPRLGVICAVDSIGA
jgi:RNA polymerase sigma-70 factor (ECF subfamily)